MVDKAYDFEDLIGVYIKATPCSNFPHEFPDYYCALLAKLEEAFGLRLSMEDMSLEQQYFFTLFAYTADSYRKICTPWDDFQEEGVFTKHLATVGDVGNHIYEASDKILELAEENRVQHLNMLHSLFEAIYGPTTTIVTSAQLRDIGFDDSTEPRIEDYEESAMEEVVLAESGEKE